MFGQAGCAASHNEALGPLCRGLRTGAEWAAAYCECDEEGTVGGYHGEITWSIALS